MMLEDQYKQACDELNEKKKQIKANGTFKVVQYKLKEDGKHDPVRITMKDGNTVTLEKAYIEERVRPQSAERRAEERERARRARRL